MVQAKGKGGLGLQKFYRIVSGDEIIFAQDFQSAFVEGLVVLGFLGEFRLMRAKQMR